MGLIKVKLGEYIFRHDLRNSDNSIRNVMGISVTKQFRIPTSKVNVNELSNYKIVKPNQFAFVQTTHNEKVFAYAFNRTSCDIVVSSVNEVFSTDQNRLLPEYLEMYLNRPDFDRYARFNSWGSAREIFSWKDLSDVLLVIPTITVQQKYVDVYNAMLANQRAYERGLDDLKLTCDAYIERLRKEIAPKPIGQYIQRYDERNSENKIKNVMGVSVYKQFRTPTSKVNIEELSNYKIVRPRQISFVQTTHNEKVFAYAFNNTDSDIVVTSVNEVFSTDEARLLPEYLSLFFNRTEFDRYARFHSWGSARETFTWSDLIEVKFPIPDSTIQISIVNIYNAFITRREINEKLKAQIKDICPILIKGSIEEAKRLT